ncbi:MAG: response regulator [Gemmatimonadaceae bacterium]|nr:response regulator [Gemmatimonadaceae bacterium]
MPQPPAADRSVLLDWLFERSADAHLIIDRGAFVDCNQAAVEMLRHRTKQEFLATHPSQLSPPIQPDGRDSYEKANEMMAIAERQGSHRFEWMHVRADGEVFPVEVLLTTIPLRDRNVIHVVWRDITARKQLEDHLRLAQKMEAMGRMAGGIAHDFNNLLVAILGNAELLADLLKDHPEALTSVDEIHAAGNRAAALVRQMMTFARRQPEQVSVIDLPTAVRELEPIMRRLLDERYRLDLRLGNDALRVEAAVGQLEQVMLNLVANARDAMPTGGRVLVELRHVEFHGGAIGAGVELPDVHYALLTVSDFGTGMPADIARRAFEPFFTTKDVGRGTGFGLATVYAIATQRGGSAEIESVEGHGTSVRVYLPVTSHPVTPASVRAVRSVAQGSETVLVVEDEPAVATLVVRVLRGAGYRVMFAGDGLQALDTWGSSPRPVDLVLSDVMMPRLGGADLARRMRALGYAGPVLLMSGYARESLADATGLPSDAHLLAKPFTSDALLRRVRTVLDTKAD